MKHQNVPAAWSQPTINIFSTIPADRMTTDMFRAVLANVTTINLEVVDRALQRVVRLICAPPRLLIPGIDYGVLDRVGEVTKRITIRQYFYLKSIFNPQFGTLSFKFRITV